MTETRSPDGFEAQGAPPPSTEPPPPGRRAVAQQALTTLGLVALVTTALLGGNVLGLRERLFGSETPILRPPAVSRVAEGPAPPATASGTVLRSQPWWQKITVLEGSGTARTAPFTIAEGALQWRVRGICDAGRLVVSDPSRPRPLLDAPCRATGTDHGFATRAGTRSLEVTAGGPWRLEVEQQVDVPLVEPPLPEMSAPGTKLVATGDLYRIDQTGTGKILVYRLADGTYALRLDTFFVTANVDLEIRLSPLEAPRTTQDYLSAAAALAAPLDITAGSLNFVVPRDVDPTRYRSVVIWCPLITSAYAAATLEPAA